MIPRIYAMALPVMDAVEVDSVPAAIMMGALPRSAPVATIQDIESIRARPAANES